VPNQWNRREFLKFIGVGAAMYRLPSLAMAKSKQGSFQIPAIEATDRDDLVLTTALSSQVVMSWQDVISASGEKFAS